MSQTILISYDLGGPETIDSYKRLIERIKTHGSWAKPLESFWLVQTTHTTSAIRDDLKQFLDSNDKLVVLDVTSAGWASLNLSSEVVTWMKESL